MPTDSRRRRAICGTKQEAAIGGMVSAIGGVLPCNDGYVAISPREDAQWERWLEVMGQPAWASDARYATRAGQATQRPGVVGLAGGVESALFQA